MSSPTEGRASSRPGVRVPTCRGDTRRSSGSSPCHLARACDTTTSGADVGCARRAPGTTCRPDRGGSNRPTPTASGSSTPSQFAEPRLPPPSLDHTERFAIHPRRHRAQRGSTHRHGSARPAGGPCRAGGRTGTRLLPSLSHVVPCAASRPSSALPDSFVNRLALAPASTVSGPRVLPSTGIARLHQYCDPIRHPKGPVPCLATPPSASAATPTTPRGFPCCTRSLYAHAVATTPAEPLGARVVRLPQRRRPSPNLRRVGFRIALFEACSAFTARYGLCAR